MDDATSAIDALAAALKAGTITNAEYASQARELGASTATVAAVLRSVIYAAGPAEHVKTLTTAASSSSSSTIASVPAPAPASVEAASTAAVSISDGDASVSAVEAALNWLTTRDQRWGMRAAERLNPDNDFLHDLDLYDGCGIDDEGARQISVLLRENMTVTSINLSCNKIGAEGAQQLSQALRENGTVTRFSLQGNAIGDAGAAALADMLEMNSTLTELDCGGQATALSEQATLRLRKAWGERPADGLQLK